MGVDACLRRRGGCTCTETVITCTGDLGDPAFPRKFRTVLKELRGIVCKGSDERLRVRKMEPWNSVRVTFSIGTEAAERLRALAEAGGEVLARLGILSVQMPNGQVISVRGAATPSTPPNTVAPAASSIPPLVQAAGPGSGGQHQAPTFPFTSMAQASAIVSREAKGGNPQSSHYPPPPYAEPRGSYAEPPQASPLLVNLLQTDQSATGSSCIPGRLNSGQGPGRPAAAVGGLVGRTAGVTAPPPPYSSRPAPSLAHRLSPPSSLSLSHSSAAQPPVHSSSLQGEEAVSRSDPTPAAPPTGGQPQKRVQYLINPLTGVLEPMSSESESEAEGPCLNTSAEGLPPSPSPRPPLSPLLQSQVPPLSVKEEEGGRREEDKSVVPAPPVSGAPAAAPAPAPVAAAPQDMTSTPDDDRPKGEEKIKLRLKIEKSESYNLSYKAEGGSAPPAAPPGGQEPRVPPLHISLRGRPAVVSRKEKRQRKDDSRERDREPLSQGTFEGTCQFPSEAEVASILRSIPEGEKVLNTTPPARRKRDKKKVYPRSVPRVEEKLKKGSGSLLKSVVKSAAKEVRIMAAQRTSSKPVQHKKPPSPGRSGQELGPSGAKQEQELMEPDRSCVPVGRTPAGGSGAGDDSGIESMDALSEKSPNQSVSPLRKEEQPVTSTKDKKKEIEEVQPIRLTPALYTYSNPERQREETPSPDHTEEDRFGGKSLLEQLLIDIPNGDSQERTRTLRRSPETSPSLGKRGRRPSESSSSDPPTPRPNKRKCSENASELIKACMDEGNKRDSQLPQGDNADSSDDDSKQKDQEDRLRMSEEKLSGRSTYNSRRSTRQAEIRERPQRKGSVSQKKDEGGGKRRRNSKEK